MKTKTRTNRTSFRPSFETLEDRRQLAASTVFVLDYTPDYRSMGSLHETFYNVRFKDGSAPAMFDFDGDRQLTANDVTVAANQITARVRGYFSNYLNTTNLRIIGGDVNANSNQLLGDQWLRYGLQTKAANVSVMFLGGRSVGGEYGRAPLAREGYNVEGFGEVYVRTIAIDLVNRNPRATPTEFAIAVASTTAHELGHMMGLRHAASGPANNIMVPGRGRANNYFPNQAVYTEGGAPQNAHHELWYSLRGQPTYYQVVNYGVPDPAMEHGHDHLHEHVHDDHVHDEQSVAQAVDQVMEMEDFTHLGHEFELPNVNEPEPHALAAVDALLAGFDELPESLLVRHVGERGSQSDSQLRSTRVSDGQREIDPLPRTAVTANDANWEDAVQERLRSAGTKRAAGDADELLATGKYGSNGPEARVHGARLGLRQSSRIQRRA